LSEKVFEEINKLRKNPKSLIKQLDRSLNSFKGSKILAVAGRPQIQTSDGAAAYMEAIEILEI
jgi:hypothetical protein